MHDPVFVDLDLEVIFSQVDGVFVHFGMDVLAPRLLAGRLIIKALTLRIAHILYSHQVPLLADLYRPADLARPE